MLQTRSKLLKVTRHSCAARRRRGPGRLLWTQDTAHTSKMHPARTHAPPAHRECFCMGQAQAARSRATGCDCAWDRPNLASREPARLWQHLPGQKCEVGWLQV